MSTHAEKKPAGYKVGMVLLSVASLLYVVGFATPYWIVATGVVRTHTVVRGLWAVCGTGEEYLFSSANGCHFYENVQDASFEFLSNFWHFERLVFTVTLMGLLLACGLALAVNLFNFDLGGSWFRLVEVAAYGSGLLGCLGCWLLSGAMHVTYGRHRDNLRDKGRSFPVTVGLGWSFHLAFISTTIIVIAAVVTAVFNRPSLCKVGVQSPAITTGRGDSVW